MSLVRRQLSALVYRDASRAYGVGVAVVGMCTAYLLRAWPPGQIRAAVGGMQPTDRAILLASVTMAYVVLTIAVVRRLVASRRLALFWGLPLSRWFWRRLHARHLLLLNVPWLLVVAYGVAPGWSESAPRTVAWLVVGIGAVVIPQVVAVALADRPWRLLLAVTGLGVGAFLAYAGDPTIGAFATGAAILACAWRLGRPFPEPSRRAWMRRSSSSVAWWSLAGTHLIALARRRTRVTATIVGISVAFAAAAVLAFARIGATEPAVASRTVAVAAMLAAAIGASAAVVARRAASRDRWAFDAMPIRVTDETSAAVIVAIAGLGPALIVVAFGVPTRAAFVAVVAAGTWAATGMARLGFVAEARRWSNRRVVAVVVARVLAAVAVILGPGSVALVVWAGLSAYGLPRAVRAATLTRRRFETATRDDDHG